ncbi:MAG: metalloregulator ArsR/SmtB family transcription factor [Microbacteriaceae bacterium]
MVDIFVALSDESRRGILELLLQRYVDESSENGGMNVSELVEHTQLSQPTVSKQLKVLREVGLVSVRSEGQQRFYTLETAPLEAVEDWLIPFLSADFDDTDEDELLEHLYDHAENLRPSADKAVGGLLPEWPEVVLGIARNAGETAAQVQGQLTHSVDFVNDQVQRVRAYVQGFSKN